MEDQDQRQPPPIVEMREVTPPAAYSIAVREAAGVSVLVLRGELDLAAAPQLSERVDAVAPGQALVIDLAETTFIDSAVLRELLRARAELAGRGGRVVLAGITEPVRRLLELTRTSELFDEEPDAATAIKRLSD